MQELGMKKLQLLLCQNVSKVRRTVENAHTEVCNCQAGKEVVRDCPHAGVTSNKEIFNSNCVGNEYSNLYSSNENSKIKSVSVTLKNKLN
jgi:hypothetical protein